MEEESGADHVEEVSIAVGVEDDGDVSDDSDFPDLVDDESSDDSDAEEEFQGDIVYQLPKYDSDDDEDSDDISSDSRSGFTTNGGKGSEVPSKVSKCAKRKFVRNKETRNGTMQNTTGDKCFELLTEATEAVAGIAEEAEFPPMHEGSGVLKANLALKGDGYDKFLIDSGAAYSTTPNADGLSNLQRLRKMLNLEYADGSIGARIACEGTLSLNGHEIKALVSPDLKEGLLSTPQMDKELNATTIQTDGRSITFVPDERQEQVLDILLEEMNPLNIVADAKLNDDGLYEVKYKRDHKRTLSVTVFPRVAANSLTQAVYLLHASLGHML